MKRRYFAPIIVIVIIYTTGCWRHNPKEHSGSQTNILKNLTDSSSTIRDENFYGVNSIKPIDYQWAHFTDTIGKLFILQFEYPDKYVAEQIQNTISIGVPIKEPLNDITNTMEWLIAIEDGEIYPVNYIIDQVKSNLDVGEVAIQDTVKLSGHNAVRLTIQRNGITKKVIVQEKHPVTIVIKDQGRIEGFERFFESIRFIEFIKQ